MVVENKTAELLKHNLTVSTTQFTVSTTRLLALIQEVLPHASAEVILH